MAIGEDLESLIAYGDSLLSSSDSIDTRLLIVPASIHATILQELHDAFESVGQVERLPTMVATREEIISSCDVFPITFLEMKRGYRVVHGVDVLSELDISHEHLRLRCEQELKNLVLRMQNQYFRHADSDDLRTSLMRSMVAFRRALAATFFLTEGKWVMAKDLWQRAAESFGWDAKRLQQCLRVTQAETSTDLESLRAVYTQVIALVTEVAQFVDAIPVSGSMLEIIDVTDEAGGA